MSDPAPATNLDPNTWYHITEQYVDHDYRTEWKSILQINQDPKVNDDNLHVWPVKTDDGNVTGYWQFQPVTSTPGRYMLRYSHTGVDVQLSVCLHNDVDDLDTKTRPCLRNATNHETQQWDIAEWKSNNTYRFVNVHNGTKSNMDCMSNGPVFMSPDVDGRPYQSAQHWMMISASKHSSITSGTNSDATTDSKSSSSTQHGLSSGATAGIAVGVVLGVIALALAGFFVWRSKKRKSVATNMLSGSPTENKKASSEEGSSSPPYKAFGPEDVGKSPKPFEMDGDGAASVAELPGHQRFELP
ncbi:transmembrane alpha-helix protein [Fusarium austroafricanum]|uniref:Transmembrane alpha-helix protein n=1 Tax=Fusarium austroafricanum TaxID=2364996 RepID=A0A8H4K1Z0_9HYPO|nr:transmembrane alpha-helix protein [Fusarium austroafricanum]